MSTVAFDVEAVRARFSALRRPLAFFDGPGGTQVPDEVIEAIASYLREANANVRGEYATSRATDALVASARLTGAGWLGCAPEEEAAHERGRGRAGELRDRRGVMTAAGQDGGEGEQPGEARSHDRPIR